jgi:hypothetical protein
VIATADVAQLQDRRRQADVLPAHRTVEYAYWKCFLCGIFTTIGDGRLNFWVIPTPGSDQKALCVPVIVCSPCWDRAALTSVGGPKEAAA